MRGARRAPGRTVRAPARSRTWGEPPMEPREPRPDTIQALRWGADAAFAMLAGLQLDGFTPLQCGPLTPAQLDDAFCGGSHRLPFLIPTRWSPGALSEPDQPLGKDPAVPDSPRHG